jgi:hypothetical protein
VQPVSLEQLRRGIPRRQAQQRPSFRRTARSNMPGSGAPGDRTDTGTIRKVRPVSLTRM